MSNLKAGPIALLIKLGPKLLSVGAKLAKSAKVTKVGLAGASAVSYAYLWTWEFAIMVMVMLFVHESGHVWAMRRFGVPTKGFYFLPFIGGAAVAEDRFPTRWSEVYIALAGPVWGGSLAVLAIVGYMMTGSPLLAAVASWMALVNLFNLLPVNPLDGGRVMKSIALSIHSGLGLLYMSIGVVVAVFFAYSAGIPLLGLLAIVGYLDLLFEWRTRHLEGPPSMNGGEIFASVAGFVLIAGVLYGIMLYASSVPDAALALEMLRD